MPKETSNWTFFHDRIVLLQLSLNTILALTLLIMSVLTLTDSDAGYIRQYREDLGLDGFKAGTVGDMLAFGVFAVIVYVFQMVFSIKLYKIRRQISELILLITTFVYIFALLVLNELLSLI